MRRTIITVVAAVALGMAAMTTGAMAGMVVAAAISVAAVTPEAMGPDMVATWFGPAKSRVPPLYPLTRACEGRADMSAVGQQRDPLAPPGRRCGC